MGPAAQARGRDAPIALIPLTVRHVYDFGEDRPLVGDDLVRPEAWDALRTQTSGPFAMPADRADWEAEAAGVSSLVDRARAINAWLDGQSISSVASYGVGGASLEFLLWREAPTRRLVLSDYGPATVDRLRTVFPEVEVRQFDLLADPPLSADIHLFHRIDTEFDNATWRDVLRRFADQRILFAASDLIGHRRAREVRARQHNPDVTSAGWLRNRAAMHLLWRRTHSATHLRMHDLHAWDLQPRR